MGDRSLVRDVCIVSDNPSARVLVSSLVTMMGHRPVDYGELARWMLVTSCQVKTLLTALSSHTPL